MTSYAKIGVVTGANKGIGYSTVRQLALQYPGSPSNKGPLLIYLTARNEQRGQEALNDLLTDRELQDKKVLEKHGGLTSVEYLPLDIDSESSIKNLAAELKKRHPDGIDFLINNAGIAMEGFDNNVVQKTLRCNYYGTLLATQTFLPQIREGGRIVNLGSMAGHLTSKYAPEIKSRFLRAKKPEEITQLMKEFTAAVQNDTYRDSWPGAAYAVSKAGVIGLTKTIAAQVKASGSSTLINVLCTGWVSTSMSKFRPGGKTPDEGAQTPVLLAIHDIGGVTGGFWQHEKEISWDADGFDPRSVDSTG